MVTISPSLHEGLDQFARSQLKRLAQVLDAGAALDLDRGLGAGDGLLLGRRSSPPRHTGPPRRSRKPPLPPLRPACESMMTRRLAGLSSPRRTRDGPPARATGATGRRPLPLRPTDRERTPAPAGSDAPAALRHCEEARPPGEADRPETARAGAQVRRRSRPGERRGPPRTWSRRFRRRRLSGGFPSLAGGLGLGGLLGLDAGQFLFAHHVAGGLDALAQRDARPYHGRHVLEARPAAAGSWRTPKWRPRPFGAARSRHRRGVCSSAPWLLRAAPVLPGCRCCACRPVARARRTEPRRLSGLRRHRLGGGRRLFGRDFNGRGFRRCLGRRLGRTRLRAPLSRRPLPTPR